MVAKTKAVNYTDEQVAILKAGYTGTDNKGEVKALAAEVSKPEASVRAKLANLGIYVKDVAEKAIADRVSKRDLVEKVGRVVGLTEAEQEGLEKATKTAIEKVLAKLTA
jgi:hypothetical protein